MSDQTLRDPGGTPAVGESRAQVLGVLRAAPAGTGVREVAEQTGLHTNTARFHLDSLVRDGLAERAAEGGGRPGRPRTVYRAAASPRVPADSRSYQLLARMLTGLVADVLPHPAAAAVAAGEAWGRYLADTPSPGRRVDAAEAVRHLTRVLADVGFEPGPPAASDPAASEPGEGAQVIPLRHCPFREAAEEQREVVCSLHLGLMRGTLAEVRAPVAADRLQPFVEPSLCLAHLVPVRPAPPARSA